MGNKYKNLLFISFFGVFLILPKSGQAQTAPGCGDSLLREYLFPISSYEETGTPVLKKAAECEQYAKYHESYSSCSGLPASSADINFIIKTGDSNILTTTTAKFSYKFTLTDRASYDFKINTSNNKDNFNNLTNQQIDYILQNNANHDQSSYKIRSIPDSTDRSLAITEYNDLTNDQDVTSGSQKYELFKSLIFSVYLDGETAADRKGFIIINNTDPTDPQDGTVLLGNLAAGDHTVYLHFLNDFYFNFNGLTNLPAFFNNFSGVDLNKDKILDTNPILNTVSLNQITPAEDIIGIRVYCNAENKDATTWYKDNVLKPSTSIQPITVDGYKGIRDDRTVYVDAANLAENLVCVSSEANSCTVEATSSAECAGSPCQKKTFFYTNIYVIAYNQNAAPPSINIFDQMLSNWKFNKNVMEGLNFVEAEKIKDKLRRDTIRLAALNGLNKLINDYKAANGKFPTLEAGTFVKDHSISTWPSWQATLGNKLGSALPVDPLNIMAPELRGTYDCTSSDPNESSNCQNICTRDTNNDALTGCPANEQCLNNNEYCSVCPPGYDAQTCWDKINSKFAFSTFASCPVGSPLANAFNLGGTPNACNNDGAFVYQYTAINNGQSYALNYRLEYQAQDICAPGECVFNNKCYQAGSCLDAKDASANLLYKNTYCYLGAWRSSCGDGYVQDQCGEQCDPSVPLTGDNTWCDATYQPHDWYRKGSITTTCTASCEVQQFQGLGYIPPAYSSDPSVLSCGGYCGDNIVQSKSGEQCDQGESVSPLKKVEEGGSGGLSQNSQYLCSGTGGGGGAPININGAACQEFSGWDGNVNDYSIAVLCSGLTASGWVSQPAGTQNILASGGFKSSYKFTLAKDSNYSFKITAANSGDNINALTNEQIDFLFTQKISQPAGVYLYNLNDDGSLSLPEYGGVTAFDPNKYNLLRSLIFSVYVDEAITPLGFVILPAVNAANKQEGTINLGALKAGDHTITLHFVGDHFYVPLAGLVMPANLNNFSNVDLNQDQSLDINPLIYSVSLFAPELGVNKCQTFGGFCGDGLVQMEYGEQCDLKSYLTPTTAQTVNIVKNPGFETVFSPWKVLNGTVDLDNNNYFDGRSSVRVNSSGADVSLYQPAGLFSQKPYNLSVRVKLITGNISQVLIQAGDQTESDFTLKDEAPLPLIADQIVDDWQLYQLDNASPSISRYKFKIKFITDVNTSFYVDSVKILPQDNSVRPQYQCASNQTGKVCQFNGGYCGDGTIQTAFGETCDDRVGLTCNTNADCGKGTCNAATQICESISCNDTCRSTYCGDGIIQKPNSLGATEVCDWGSDPSCSFDCRHVKMGGSCVADATTPCPANNLDCRQCGSSLSCTIRNFGDLDTKCLGARGSYGCFTNDDCSLGYYCETSTTKCEPEISTYLKYHPEEITNLNLPAPTPNVKYDINNSTCPDLQSVSAGTNDQFITDRCTDINWAGSDNISKPNWTYADAAENGCSGVDRLPSITELYSLVRQTNQGLFYSDKQTLRLCPTSCDYNENNQTTLCNECGDDNYLYWSNTCTSKDAQGNCLKAQAVNFKYGSIETYDVTNKFKIHCLRDTECGNGNLEEGETCEFYRAFICQGGSKAGQACQQDTDCGAGGTCPQNFIEQNIAKKCTDFGYDAGYLHCNRTTCGFRFDNCVLNSQPNQTCAAICQGRKTLACQSVGLNINKASDQYELNTNPPVLSIANDSQLMDIDPNGSCLPGRSIDCNYRFVDRKANCKDSTTGKIAPNRSEYSYCNCTESTDVGVGGGTNTVNLPPTNTNTNAPPANNPPTVSITAPTNGAVVAGPAINIKMTASDTDGTIALVEIDVTKPDASTITVMSGAYSGTFITDGFTWSGFSAPGNYTIIGRAIDDGGATTLSPAINITVGAANISPTVSLTAPANGATFTVPANITINAVAADSDGTIVKVEFYQGTTLLVEDTSSPYNFTWSGVTAGSYSLTAKATDNENATTTSSPISITVAASSAKAITSFVVQGIIPQIVLINPADHTIAITVPAGTSVTALVPIIALTGVSVSPASGVAHSFSTPATYTVTAADATTQAYVVTVTVAASPDKAITSFNFTTPATTGVINEAAHIIAITVPSGTNVTALVPAISITGASVSPASGTARNFTSPVTYTVTATDSTTQAYVVSVYSCTGTTPSTTVATLCTDDAIGLSANTAKTAVNFCTANKCEYQCNAGYAKVGTSCVAGNLVFVTSETWTGNLGGVAGAQSKCQAEATSRGLLGTFKAWLSDITYQPSSTTYFTHPTNPYYLLNGVKIADSWVDLADGTNLDNGISLDINGVTTSSVIWTNTDNTGDRIATSTGNTCSFWTGAGSSIKSRIGVAGAVNSSWTQSAESNCNIQNKLYCFAQ